MADPKQTAHTPWRVRRIDYPRKRDVSFEIVSGNDEDESVGYFPMPICQTIMREIKRESDLISADEFHMNRIVRCVNSHEKLVEALEAANSALKEMAEWHGGTHEDDCPCDDTCECIHRPFNERVNNAINGAEAALRAAKGE